MIKSILFTVCLVLFANTLFSQLADSCKLKIGTNLGGISDYGTELPFVDLMKSCRAWYTKSIGDPASPFDSEKAQYLNYDADGYPTQIPQTVSASPFPQKACTIWAVTDGWPSGTYTLLWDGVGSFDLWGGASNITVVGTNKITFDFLTPVGSLLQLCIETSSSSNPVKNIRVIMPGQEATYLTQPFNPTWVNLVKKFKSVRFMDWGQTNNWGQVDPWSWDSPVLFDWSARQKMSHYTWTDGKGIPYEMMIRLMNDYDIDGWVCVPHRSSNDYITQMATLFKNNVEPARHLTVEYSNEIWNWMFGQANWTFNYGTASTGLPWPECTVQYIQNTMNIWSSVYAGQLNKITRAVGVQTAWQDVSNRVVFNMTPGSFDAFSPTYYFGISDETDSIMDALGSSATVSQLANRIRIDRAEFEWPWIALQKSTIGDSLNIPMIFYEGGQHVTPIPFGDVPSYEAVLLDLQRDTAMYNLYKENYEFLKTLQSGDNPLELMNFSLISNRSAQYGSWGILETMNQDIAAIPAPKWQATLEYLTDCGNCTFDASITGANTVCANQNYIYSAGTHPLGTTYDWSFTNATVISGCGSTNNTCTLSWNSAGGSNIAVTVTQP